MAETKYLLDDEMYIAVVLTKCCFSASEFDNKAKIDNYLPLLPLFKSITTSNIEAYKMKGTDEQTNLYKQLSKIEGGVLLEKSLELAVCAYNANLGIYARDLTHLLTNHLRHDLSGLYEYQLEKEIECYFDADEWITRKKLDEFIHFILREAEEE